MTPVNAVPRPVRAAAAVVGVLGIVTLSACAPADAEAEDQPAASTGTGAPADSGSDGGSDSGSAGVEPTYADGTYTAEGAYQTPETVETITVTLTLVDDVITDVEVTGDPQARETEEYQGKFIGGIADVVVGKDIDEISVSRVAGSSLTSGGFTQAVEEIKSEAAA
jgi:uncharacterized protein with FMN-binding domain